MHFVLRGYQGIPDQPGKKPFIQILILAGKVIVAKMYLNLIIIIIPNQYFDSFLTNSGYLRDILNLSDHNPSNKHILYYKSVPTHALTPTHTHTQPKQRFHQAKLTVTICEYSLIFSIYFLFHWKTGYDLWYWYHDPLIGCGWQFEKHWPRGS